MAIKISVTGGDKRLRFLEKLVKEDGRFEYENDAERADIIVSGIPFKTEGEGGINVDLLLEKLAKRDKTKHPKTVFAAGVIPQSVVQKFEEANVIVADFNKRDDFAILNAIPTAEGTISFIMGNTDKALDKLNVAVLGAGRVGKVLSYKLKQSGANVTAVARKSYDRAFMTALGIESCDFGAEFLGVLRKSDVIVNTVPRAILGDAEDNAILEDTLIIDLSSGADFGRGIKLPALPGKVAPQSAAAYIKDVIINIMAEVGGVDNYGK